MTVTAAGNNFTDFATTNVVTIAAGIAAGHGIVVVSSANKDPASMTNGVAFVTDSAGNAYRLDIQRYDATETIGMCIYSGYATGAISAGGTVTVTYQGSSGWQSYVYDVTPFAASNFVETSGQNFQTGTATPFTWTSAALSTLCTIIGAHFDWNFTLTSGGSGYTVVEQDANYAGVGLYQHVQTKDVGYRNVVNSEVTVGGSTKTVSLVVAYKQATTVPINNKTLFPKFPLRNPETGATSV